MRVFYAFFVFFNKELCAALALSNFSFTYSLLKLIKTNVIATTSSQTGCSNLLPARKYHTFSPVRKYAKNRREPSVWFSDSPDGLKGKRIGFLFVQIVFRFPLRDPFARLCENVFELPVKQKSFSFRPQRGHIHFALFIGYLPDKRKLNENGNTQRPGQGRPLWLLPDGKQ